MPKRVPPLTRLQIRSAKPAEKPYKLADGGGLYIEVTPADGKHWRMKYRRPSGKEGKLHFGAFPAVSISDAREKRDSSCATCTGTWAAVPICSRTGAIRSVR